ncbi:MAG: hypothetical protein WD530_00690 [Vicingaceae bacterium]
MFNSIKSKYLHLGLFALYTVVSVFILSFFNGVGTEADSINHYLHARYAIAHPELLLNHWAKPLFTLIAMPFAQFGIIGVKVFNFICSLLSLYFISRIAQLLNWRMPYLAAFFFILFPLSFTTTFSGYTEPLFALLLLISVYGVVKNKYTAAAILISFGPFVRSEGLIILGVFTLYFLFQKKYKYLPLLAVGHIVYSIIGSFYYGDLLWVLNKIPYAAWSTPYGKGNFFHFFEQLNYALGVPLYILFWMGFVFLTFHTFKKLKVNKASLLILLCFAAFFIAHSLFWQLGIFNSMGLKRVFAAVSPLMAIISLYGFNLLSRIPHTKTAQTLQILTFSYILIFPFTSNPAAINWEKDLNLSIAQQTADEVADFVKSNYPDHRIVYADPYLAHTLKVDPFDSKEALLLSEQSLQLGSSADLIIWDNWHAVVDQNIALEQIEQSNRYVEINRFEKSNSKKESLFVVFEKQ